MYITFHHLTATLYIISFDSGEYTTLIDEGMRSVKSAESYLRREKGRYEVMLEEALIAQTSGHCRQKETKLWGAPWVALSCL